MEKLGQLHRQALARTAAYDLIVVDTPPSRSALDFLDAPERLSSFLDGRFIRLLLAPARGPAKLMTAGLSVVTNALTKVLGAQVLRDMQTFVAAFDTLFGGFRQRAEKTFALLQADGTAFVVVAAPEPDALREAAYFVDRLTDDDMPLAGLVVNRASPSARTELSAEEAITAADRLQSGDSSSTDGRAAPAARRPGPHRRARAAPARALRRGPPEGRRPRSCPRWRATSTTSTGCARSVTCSQSRPELASAVATGRRRRRLRRRREPRPWCGRSRGWCATTSRGDGGAAHGAHARSSRPRHPTRSGCPAPRRGTRCGRGNPHRPAWPCSARRHARRVRPACRSCTRRVAAQSSTHMIKPHGDCRSRWPPP